MSSAAPPPARSGRPDKWPGLGLAIVERIARLLSPDFEVTPRVGRGSRFAVHVPRDDGMAGTVRAMESPGPPPVPDGLRGGCVPCVENDAEALHAMTLLRDRHRGPGRRAGGAAGGTARHGPADRRRPPRRGTEAIGALRAAIGREGPALMASGGRGAVLREEIRALGHGFLATRATLRAIVSYLRSEKAQGAPPPCRRRRDRPRRLPPGARLSTPGSGRRYPAAASRGKSRCGQPAGSGPGAENQR